MTSKLSANEIEYLKLRALNYTLKMEQMQQRLLEVDELKKLTHKAYSIQRLADRFNCSLQDIKDVVDYPLLKDFD